MTQGFLTRVAILSCTLVLGLGLGVGAAFALFATTTPASLLPSNELESIPVTMQTFDDPQAVEITAQIMPPTSLVTLRSGTVTAWRCSPGGALASGSSTVGIDGVGLLDLYTEVPLWRDISAGAKGADVAAVESELARLGRAVEQDGVMSWREIDEVRSLANAVGVPIDRTISRDLIVWIPEPDATVDSCETTLGEQVSSGATLFTVDSGVTLSSVQLPAGRLPGARVLELFDAPVPISETGELPGDLSGPTIRASNAFREAVSSSPEATVLALKGRAVLQEPVSVAAVPATAVLVAPDGTSCVLVDAEAIRVSIVGSEFGNSFVVFDAEENPTAVDATIPPEITSCG